MADMPTDFWAGWIVILTVVGFSGLVWLVFSIYFSPSNEPEDSDGPVWDENLREGTNPAPMWWFWLILALMVFSVSYLMLYPGLGSYSGALKWSQGGKLKDSLEAYKTKFDGVRNLIAEGELDTLRANEAFASSAQRIFDRNCAACHGYDGTGQASTFPNLHDADWQWGGEAAQIEQSIRSGRTAAMVGWLALLGEDGVVQMANYVKQLGSRGRDSTHPSDAQFTQLCTACHGADGKGNPILGAPNLTDDIWLYGNSDSALQHTISVGRSGEMPAFGDRLDDAQIRLLVMLLSQEPKLR